MSMPTHLMTAAEQVKFSRADFVLVKCELLTMSPSGAEHGAVTANLTLLLGSYLKARDLGTLYAAETGFRLETDPDTVLAPDIAFLGKGRVGSRSKGYLSTAPDLAVEVLSPSDRKSKIEQKTALWLLFGAKAVWIVDSERRTVEIQCRNGDTKFLTESEELFDDEVIPGFRALVSEIFN